MWNRWMLLFSNEHDLLMWVWIQWVFELDPFCWLHIYRALAGMARGSRIEIPDKCERTFIGPTYPSMFRAARPLVWVSRSNKSSLIFAVQIASNSDGKLLDIWIRGCIVSTRATCIQWGPLDQHCPVLSFYSTFLVFLCCLHYRVEAVLLRELGKDEFPRDRKLGAFYIF